MRYLIMAAVLAAINLAIWALLLTKGLLGWQLDAQIAAMFGTVTSVAMLGLLFASAISDELPSGSTRREAAAVIGVSAAMLFVGVAFHKVNAVPAVLVLICGSAALLIGLSAVADLRNGNGLEITSHWGGFGGSVGGWRISPAVTTVILALIFLGAAVGVAGLSDVEGNGSTPAVTNSLADGNDATDNGAATNEVETNDVAAASQNEGTTDANAASENVQAPAGLGPSPRSVVPDSPE